MLMLLRSIGCFPRVAVVLAALVCGLVARGASAQTSFTYQGVISSAGNSHPGPVDLRFRLYDAATQGTQVGAQVSSVGVPLDQGRFAAVLDFGVAPFSPNAPRWLEIDVADAGSGVFTTLTPRQPLSAAPFAINTRGLYVDALNRVGIMTASPEYTLEVIGSFHAGGLTLADAQNLAVTTTRGGATLTWQSFTALKSGDLVSVTLRGRNASNWNGSFSIYAGEGTGGTLIAGPIAVSGSASGVSVNYTATMPPGVFVALGQLYTIALQTPTSFVFDYSTANPYPAGRASPGAEIDLYFSTVVNTVGLIVADTGRVGVGTANPADALDVRGNIRLGNAGDLQAPGGEETLRILRGNVALQFSQPQTGPGWTVISGPGFGTYTITFTNPFSAEPTVVASGTGSAFCSVDVLSTSVARITLYAPGINGAQPTNGNFNFIAVGPR
jgi:hypothetical protein